MVGPTAPPTAVRGQSHHRLTSDAGSTLLFGLSQRVILTRLCSYHHHGQLYTYQANNPKIARPSAFLLNFPVRNPHIILIATVKVYQLTNITDLLQRLYRLLREHKMLNFHYKKRIVNSDATKFRSLI